MVLSADVLVLSLMLLQGLLAGSNDFDQLQNGGDCRDINRHFYSLQEAKQAVRRPVVQVSNSSLISLCATDQRP
jgi:hypothetical protein